MKEWLDFASAVLIDGINAIALLVIVVGTLETFVRGLPLMFTVRRTGREFRLLYLGFARYLVFGLTFQLAADIVETAINAGWEDLAKLGAIAVIRTFLSYFLERDMAEVSEIQRPGSTEASASSNPANSEQPAAADK